MWSLVNKFLIIIEKSFENVERADFIQTKKKNFTKGTIHKVCMLKKANCVTPLPPCTYFNKRVTSLKQ